MLDSQIIRIGQATSKCHENHKYLIEPVGKIKYNEKIIQCSMQMRMHVIAMVRGDRYIEKGEGRLYIFR